MTAPAAPIRIVHVMGWVSQQYGSFERLLVALSQRGATAGIESHFVFQGEPASAAFAAEAAATIHDVPPGRALGDPEYVRQIGRLLRRVRATHLHVHFGVDAYNALLAGRMLGVHRRFATKHITPSLSPWTLSGPRHRWLGRQVEVVWAVSRAVGDDLRRLGIPADRVEISYLGVDPTVYRPDPTLRARTRAQLGIADSTRILLSTAHLRPGKGTELLPGLAAQLLGESLDVTVLAAGRGPLHDEIEQEARRLGLPADRFRLLGVREDIPALLSAADLYVLPTQGHFEGLPLAVTEALASATPVVACAVTDLDRLPTDALMVVPQGDPAAIAAACRRLLHDPEAAAALGISGRRLAITEFSQSAAVDQHLARYLSAPRAVGA